MNPVFNEYVEAIMNTSTAESNLKQFLLNELGLSSSNIKRIKLSNNTDDTRVVQLIVVELRGTNCFRMEDIRKIEGLRIITPNKLEISVGDIPL